MISLVTASEAERAQLWNRSCLRRQAENCSVTEKKPCRFFMGHGHQVLLERNATEGESPVGCQLFIQAATEPAKRSLSSLANESSSLGVELKVSGRSPIKLNTASEPDSKQVLWRKDEKNFEKRVKECLKLKKGKGMRISEIVTRGRGVWAYNSQRQWRIGVLNGCLILIAVLHATFPTLAAWDQN